MSPTVSPEGEKNKSDNFFSSFCFRSPLGYVRKRHAYRTQLVEPVPAQVSDLKISHGKLVKKIRGARGVFMPDPAHNMAISAGPDKKSQKKSFELKKILSSAICLSATIFIYIKKTTATTK